MGQRDTVSPLENDRLRTALDIVHDCSHRSIIGL
jgi:hypothetical protein